MILRQFHKTFSEILQPILVNLFQACMGKHELQVTWSQTKLILLLKIGKYPKLIQLYRPISLVNCDYKIPTAFLATRLNRVMSSFIHPDEVGFFKNRNLRDSQLL